MWKLLIKKHILFRKVDKQYSRKIDLKNLCYIRIILILVLLFVIMAFCSKCKNTTNYSVEGANLFTICSVCRNKDKLNKEQYLIYHEVIDVSQVMQNYINPEIIHDNTYPIIKKGDETYTVILDQTTMKKKYLSHTTKQIFDSI